jgi:poly(3-hydroxybutyrate) depolymerase
MMPSIAPAVFVLVALSVIPALARPAYLDGTFASEVFGASRDYRIFLPPRYDSSEAQYPVIYYFHGHSDRYTLEHYDNGQDTVPKIAKFVANNDVIVVAIDGYVKEHYEGFYGGTPWDIGEEGGRYDIGQYFQEAVKHIDSNYRTLSSRQYRATSGLSMGGYLSFYLSARYPELIGSMSAFNPGPEFFTGPAGSRILWRPKDHVSCHDHSMVRLVRASGDYISQYHEETKNAYARAHGVDFEFRQDEYHRHWATSIDETFLFHKRAFANDALSAPPVRFSYASAYRDFKAWGYNVQLDRDVKGLVYLTDVQTNGFQITTRAWAPDGPRVDSTISITTHQQYEPLKEYKVSDLSLVTGNTEWRTVTADAARRITFTTDGQGHLIGINGPKLSSPQLKLLPLTAGDVLRVRPDEPVELPLRIHNPSDAPVRNIEVALSSEYPAVEVLGEKARIPSIEPGGVAGIGGLKVRFSAGRERFARSRIDVTLTADDQGRQTVTIDVLVIPSKLPSPDDIEILDGRTAAFSVFRQKGNQGGGEPIERLVTEGTGNGDGVLQPGEEATIWVRIPQGLDPQDKNNWHRTKVYSESPWIVEAQDIQEQKQREWTGAKDRTSLVRMVKDTPVGSVMPLILDNESWSFHYTPDMRYGSEPLYQAFQRHKHHLHEIDFTLGE